jgi:hypothetical protein
VFSIAPALEAADAETMSMEEIDAEVEAVRTARRARSAQSAQPPATPGNDADSQ